MSDTDNLAKDRAVAGPLTTFAAEGARVGAASCLICGAAILVDPREAFDAIERHREWHERGAADA